MVEKLSFMLLLLVLLLAASPETPTTTYVVLCGGESARTSTNKGESASCFAVLVAIFVSFKN
jgi:hypothetical protein